jgi:hypothetical protein
MTENEPSKSIKIKVPFILDDPIYGRILALPPFFPYNYIFIGTDYEYIIIEEGKLILKGSMLSGRKTTSFQLENIDKFILRKRKASCFDKEGKFNFLGRLGTEIELSLFDTEDKNHVIIPISLINTFGPFLKTTQNIWERFLRELRNYTGLPIEETSLS